MVAEAAKGSWADVHQPVSGNYGCCCVPCLDVEHGPRPWTGATARVCCPLLGTDGGCTGECTKSAGMPGMLMMPNGNYPLFGYHHPIGCICIHEYSKAACDSKTSSEACLYGGGDTGMYLWNPAFYVVPIFWVLSGFYCCNAKPCSEVPVSATFAARYPERLLTSPVSGSPSEPGFAPCFLSSAVRNDANTSHSICLDLADPFCQPCVNCIDCKHGTDGVEK